MRTPGPRFLPVTVKVAPMLFLLFQLGRDRYALEAAHVVEILPLVGVKEIPRAPSAVVGLFNHRGQPVPLIDLSELMLGRPAKKLLSTRIILVRSGAEGEDRLLGLIAEKATETLRRDPGDFVPSGVTNDAAAYLGPVAPDPRGFIQWIQVDQLLPPSLRAMLDSAPVEA